MHPMKSNQSWFKPITATALLALSAASAPAALLTYDATLSGANENPATASPGTGFATVAYDTSAHTLQVNITFSGLESGTTASHIHAPALPAGSGNAGVAVPFGTFPLGVTSGTFNNTIDLTLSSSWNSTYLTANGGTPSSAEAAFASALASDEAYWNVHTTTFGSGAIRGFLTPVPEPSSLALLGIGTAAWAIRRRKAV
jgi:hypothetical protein